MRLFACVFLLVGSVIGVRAQDVVHTSTVTLGLDGAGPHDVAPVYKANYEYRLTRHLAVEAGVDFTVISKTNYYVTSILQPGNLTSYFTSTGQYFLSPYSSTRTPVMVPFGVKRTLPLRDGRVELFGGLGAAYTFNAAYYTCRLWLAQASLGARVSLDRGRRFWIGTTWRGFNVTPGLYLQASGSIGKKQTSDSQ